MSNQIFDIKSFLLYDIIPLLAARHYSEMAFSALL
jgi:hypothetical protein